MNKITILGLFTILLTILLSSFYPPSVKNAKTLIPQPSTLNPVKLGKPIVLTTLDAIAKPDFKALKTNDLDKREAHAAFEKLTTDERQDLSLGGQNAVIYWNNITREWIAAHNNPPLVLPDSSGYPTPDPSRPTDNPRYPFATPTVASRILAYVSVGQYDALLVAQHWQNTIPNPQSPILSEDVVVASVSVTLLQFFFPAEVQNIELQYKKAVKYAFLSEKYDKSTLLRSEQLGKEVAGKIIEKAKSDRHAESEKRSQSSIINPQSSTWSSIQKPVRPAIDPNFGMVKMWLVADVASVRPPQPLPPTREALKSELDTLRRYSRVGDHRDHAIMVKWADPEFSHTPAGHWNLIATEILRGGKKDNLECAKTFAYLNMAMMDATIACWEAKYFYNYPRPIHIDKTIQPNLPMPNFPSYPSGHSSFSGAAAVVLAHFFPENAKKLNEMAEEASRSRLLAGLHFKMDCEAGMVLGKKLGELAVARYQKDKVE
jgi:PAP2 superfamily